MINNFKKLFQNTEMPVKKCKLSLFIKLYLLSVYLTWKFVVNGHFNYQQDSMAIFSDNSLPDFETFIDFSNQNNHLSFNGSNFQRFDSNASSLCGNTLAQMIASNNNYVINAIESKRKYLSCENLIELICNPLIDKKLIVTHSVFDCDEYIKMAQMQQNVSLSNLIRVVSLSPSIRQIQVVLTGLMNRFSILNYAIIYSNSTQNDFYKSLAGYLLFKFSIDSRFTLEFSLPIEDSKIGLLLKDNLKIQLTLSKVKN
ncbi:hypothetical protein BpHYR1_019879 [Brachionus plicatilis]|uniref:Uncharacterized protein n=1 Tax=Brachionus plicatilis TaxID=10195 RepID=A0A3M7T9F8_BRAPC|nr:hypothetical protein BpHYR1_019879 [Brachionus plicatilis]